MASKEEQRIMQITRKQFHKNNSRILCFGLILGLLLGTLTTLLSVKGADYQPVSTQFNIAFEE
ncbi:hypothetical protein WB876_003760 [Vibrio vulnificus]